MNLRIVLLIILCALATACKSVALPAGNNTPSAVTATPTPDTNAVAEADKLYLGRGEDLGKVRSAVTILRGAQAADANNYDVAWRLSKFNYYLGDNTDDTAERDSAFDDGIRSGKVAATLQPDKPDGHFWWGANLGGKANGRMIDGLASVEDIRREMNEVIRTDEKFQGGAAYLALGQLELEVPKMMGGDPKKALEYLEKGVKFSDTNALTRFWLAKAYLANGRKADAKAKLDEIFKMKADPEYLPEFTKVKADAEKLLKDEFGK